MTLLTIRLKKAGYFKRTFILNKKDVWFGNEKSYRCRRVWCDVAKECNFKERVRGN